MRLIKAALLMIATVIAFSSVAADNKKYESMDYAGHNFYLNIQNGKIYGIYYVPELIDHDKPWLGCSDPVTEIVTVVSVSPDDKTVDTFRIKTSKGDYSTFDISPIYKEIPNFARGYVSSLIKQDAKIKLTSRICGTGGFPTFVAAEPVKKS
jgi:hypothetical protein